MRQTLIAIVENKPGVLNRVASLFRRRNFNIDSLNVGRTDNPDVSRMTLGQTFIKGTVFLAASQLVKAPLKRIYTNLSMSSTCKM